MNYTVSMDELKKFKYPNLIAELCESHYSICTLGEHMGLGHRRKENDPEVWAKLRGEEDMLASEAFGLARLFGADPDYLFADTLTMIGDYPMAVIRWMDSNREREQDQRRYEIECLIHDMMKELMSLSILKIKECKTEWLNQLRKEKYSSKVMQLCEDIISVVLEIKGDTETT